MYSSNTNLAINYIELNDFENAIKYLYKSIKAYCDPFGSFFGH